MKFKIKNKSAGMPMSKLISWIILIIAFILIVAIIYTATILGGDNIKEFAACNNDMRKCACLLMPFESQQAIIDAGRAIQCPAGVSKILVDEYSSGCPKTCNPGESVSDFKERIEQARDSYADGAEEEDVFGHCCQATGGLDRLQRQAARSGSVASE